MNPIKPEQNWKPNITRRKTNNNSQAKYDQIEGKTFKIYKLQTQLNRNQTIQGEIKLNEHFYNCKNHTAFKLINLV